NGVCNQYTDRDACNGVSTCGWSGSTCAANVYLPHEVPYKFCPDEWAGYSWVECQMYDKGGNELEVTRDRMERYQAYYFFTNFKRDRYTFNDWSYINDYLSRMYTRYFENMTNVYVDYLWSYVQFGLDKDGKMVTLSDFPLGRDWAAAGMEGLNFLTSIVQQP